jgi:hypothetical protein
MSISSIGKDGTNIATISNGLPVFTGDAAASPAGVGAVRLFTENDPGTVTGTPYLLSPETSSDFRLRVGTDTLLYDHTPTETSPDTTRMKISGITTMTTTMASGFIALNAGAAATVSGNFVSWSTNKVFRIRGASTLYVEIEANFSGTPIANQIVEIGLYLPTAGIAPTDGVWIQVDSTGIKGIISSGGTTTATGVIATIAANVNYHFTLSISDQDVEFWRDDILLADIEVPTGQASPCLTDSLPVTLMQRNSGTVSASGQAITKVGNICVSAGDLAYNKAFTHQMAGIGHSGYQAQAGATMGTTAAFPNATAATTLTGTALSQTVANVTGLGGQANITAAVAGIDGIITAYQVPVGSITQPPRNLTITGIKISSINVGAAVATTASVLAWSLAFGATGATIPSLAQAEAVALTAVTAKSWRRVPLGFQAWAVAAAIGAQATDIVLMFDSPIVVMPGEWVAAVAKFVVGTATASQVIHCHVTPISYFD